MRMKKKKKKSILNENLFSFQYNSKSSTIFSKHLITIIEKNKNLL